MFLVSVVMPILLALGYMLMFSSKVVGSLPIAICDEDQTSTSRTLVNMFKSRDGLIVKYQTGNIYEAKKRLDRKEVVAVIYIPEKFESGVMGLSSPSVKAMIDGSYLNRASMSLKSIQTIFTAMNIGVETQLLSSQGIPEEKAMELSYPIVMDQHLLFNPYSSYAYFLLPGLLPLITVVFTLFVTIFAVGSELRYGTAKEWLEMANGNIWIALLGKLTIFFIIFNLEALFFNTIVFRYFGLGIDFMQAVFLLVGQIMLIVAYMAVGIAIIALTSSIRFALSVATVYGVAAFSFSGLTFPTLSMTAFIRTIGYIFPFYYYMDLFIDQAMRSNHYIEFAVKDILMFCLFTLIMLASVPLLRKRCTDIHSYGKL